MESTEYIISPEVVAIIPCGVIGKPSTEGDLSFNDMKEIWKDVTDYEGYYQVSNLGRVRSIDRVVFEHNGKLRPLKGRTLKTNKNTKGYLHCALSKQGVVKHIRVHRLVSETFIDNPRRLPEVNHRDEDEKDNCISNLEWCTHLQNIRHGTGIERSRMSQTGVPNTKNRGEGCGTSKLTENQVIAIFNDSRKYKEISKEYNIVYSYISKIKNKQTWKHLTKNL